MKSFLAHQSQRRGFHGWALKTEGGQLIPSTTSTTRAEVREEKARLEAGCRGLSGRLREVKVSITVEEIK